MHEVHKIENRQNLTVVISGSCWPNLRFFHTDHLNPDRQTDRQTGQDRTEKIEKSGVTRCVFCLQRSQGLACPTADWVD